ncbi:MAG: phosphoenolpyruvate kinase, partial [Deltaproteobacteria bacterium]|nr:phosphoenolpyruvate kinase [Deltaproteobacteria bacterium]
MASSLNPELTRDLLAKLRASNLAFVSDYPGESGARQPVHTVYGGAHLFKGDTAKKMGAIALKSLDEYFPDDVVFGHTFGLGAHASIV